MTTTKPTITLAVSDHAGQYCPQEFAQGYLGDLRKWEGVSKEDRDILLAGPDHEWYWDAWNSILDSARHRKTNYSVYQDGDVWLVNYDNIGCQEDIDDGLDVAAESVKKKCHAFYF